MTSKDAFDYVIIGAGSAGCTLANRLSADGQSSVLLLEAGGWDRDPLIHIPLGWGKILQKRLHDWMYFCEPEPNVDNRRIECARGKVVGGCSSVNAMAYVRGNPGDYDRWGQHYGITGWSFDEVLPYFRKQEQWEGGSSAFRGGDGPIGTQFCRYADPLIDAYIDAARESGHGWTDDYNGEIQEGFARLQMSIRDGRRSSGSTAYLKPVLERPNLEVQVRALATRILFEGERATGVEYAAGKQVRQATARKEVILCGGVINSPQLLMLSGIGAPGELARHSIKVRVPLEGVGKNLQDHVSAILMYTRKQPGPFLPMMRADRIVRAMIEAYRHGTGFASDVPGGVTAFLKSEDSAGLPDIQILLTAAPLAAHPYMKPFKAPFPDGFASRVVLLHPESRGVVELDGPEPDRLAIIKPKFLSTDHDWRVLRTGVKLAHEVASRPSMQPFVGKRIAPASSGMDDQDIDQHIRSTAITVHHPLGTCRIGANGDDDAVVDNSLRVRGVDGLRVVDASVIPEMISGNINAAVVMIAERAADLIQTGNMPEGGNHNLVTSRTDTTGESLAGSGSVA